MAATRKRNTPPPPKKKEKATPKKATKTIKKPVPKPQGVRKSTRTMKQFVPFEISTKKTPKESALKEKKAKAIVKSIKKRAESVHRAKSVQKTQKTKAGAKRPLPKAAKKEKKPAAAKDKNLKLERREFIESLTANPFLFGSNVKAARKLVSATESTRLALRFVLQKDIKSLEKLVNDKNKFPSDGLDFGYAFESCTVPETLAAFTEDRKMVDAVLRLQKNLKEETEEERSSRPLVAETLLAKMSSGVRNRHMLGHATRVVEMTRGGREGNNALLNYDARQRTRDLNWDARRLLEKNVSFATLEHLISSKDSSFDSHMFNNKIVHAVRMGNRKLAGKMAETYNSYAFNKLQIQTLLNDKQPLEKCMPVSTTKKSIENAKITPFHTAAINPNETYLKNIVEVDSNFNLPDSDNWYTIHYAAVCEGTGPLKYLLKKETPVLLASKRKETPIHAAAAAGRVENLKILVEYLRNRKLSDDKEVNGAKDTDDEDGPSPPKKSKRKVAIKDIVTAQLNAKERRGYSPLHLAASHERLDVVKFLLDQPEIVVETQCGAGNGKLTPLMIACRRGNLEIANLLIDQGHAFIDKRDKLTRTALTHAAMNGHTHVVAMLLRRGSVIGDSTDSSGNSAVHYACAYGWMDILQLLAKVDPESLTAPNAWHLTPLSVAYLKGHFDIVDYLLNGEYKDKVSVNGKDNQGSTLIASVVGSYSVISEEAIKEQVDYLLERGTVANTRQVDLRFITGADSSIVDVQLRTPLHIFAATPAVFVPSKSKKRKNLTVEKYLAIADSLIDSGADIFAKDNDGEGALHMALKAGNIVLANHLFDKDPVGSAEALLSAEGVEAETKRINVLHLLAELPRKVYDQWKRGESVELKREFFDVVPFVEKLLREADKASLVFCSKEANHEGVTPLVLLSYKIGTFYSSVEVSKDDNSVQKLKVAKNIVETMCGLAKRFIDVFPQGLLAKCELPEKKENKGYNGYGYQRQMKPKAADKKSYASCMSNALQMVLPKDGPEVEEFDLNEWHCVLSNPLLKVILEKAKEHDLLKAILLEKVQKELTPLLFSVSKNRSDEARYILYVAEKNGLLKTILKEKYVEERPNESGRGTHIYKCSALMIAAKRELNDLLDGFSPSDDITKEEDTYGNTVMHTLVQQSCRDSLKHLIRFSDGGVPMKANLDGLHPLHYAVDSKKAADTDVSTDVVDWILNCDSKAAELQDAHGRTPLHYAFVGKLSSEVKKFEISQEGTKRDPIAVVCVLLKFMNAKSINFVDKFGNTALHYAAFHGSNICAITLLQKGAKSEVLNLQGNAPLCFAVLKEHEYVTLTLIQAKSDVCRLAYGDKLSRTEEEQVEELWKWIPNRVAADNTLKGSIASFVVRNGWQGVIYIILDLLSKCPSTLLDLITAAVEHRKYNLLNMLLKLLERQNSTNLVVETDVIFHFFDNLSEYSEALNDQTKTALQQLLGAGFKLGSESLITVANHGGVEILDQLEEMRDLSAILADEQITKKLLVGFIRSWPNVGPARVEKLKKWIQKCLEKVSVDSELEFPKPAFEGMEEFQVAKPEQKQNTTPLIWAIQNGDCFLLQYLITDLKADVNKPDSEGRTPLMIAVMWNSTNIVNALFDPSGPCKSSPKRKPNHRQQNGNTARISRVINRALGKRRPLRTLGTDDSSGESEAESEDHALSDMVEDMEEDEMEEAYQDEDGEQTAKKNGESRKLKNLALDFNKKDGKTRGLVHYFVEPFGWENEELLKAVCKVAPQIQKQLETPMKRALDLGQFKMAAAMAKIAKLSNPQWSPKEENVVLPLPCSHDILADSKAFLDAKMVSHTAEKKKLKPKPNDNSGYADSGDLVRCEENDTLFRILLNKSDVQYGMYGFHNFYRMEIIQRRGSSLYILFTNWGRIGDDVGQFQRTPYSTLEEAAKEFASVFRQKTGNEWSKLAQFEEKPGKYRIVEIEDEGGVDLAQVEMKMEISEARVDSDPIYRIFNDISDVKRLQDRTRSLKYDWNRTMSVPFGRLNRKKIQKASETLDELQLVVGDIEKVRKEGGQNTNRLLRLLKQQVELSNEFYKNMPLEGFTHCRLPVIDNEEHVKNFQKCIEQLFEFDTAGTLITAAIHSQSQGKDPIDYISEALECRLEALNPDSDEAQRILQNIQNSSSTQVIGIFKVVSKEPTEAYAKSKLKNRKYLWHGTKPENLLSILKHGLRATPSSAVQTGQIHGEGIYFADVFSKSEAYCSRSPNGSKYAFLCEVAQGEVANDVTLWYFRNKINNKQIKSKRIDTIKVWGRKRPNDDFDLTLPNGVTMPLGSTVNSNRVELNGNRWTTPSMWSRISRTPFVVISSSSTNRNFVFRAFIPSVQWFVEFDVVKSSYSCCFLTYGQNT
ncbi:hypothetical protein L596_028039 [Steinernema carpocapsae]|uniref:Poly [ADP-ribose] polymerase n=1 Tax=Steinernema carpocapsae TaxID=34508 RepID=A0A4U5LX91_STECR|nr:hypothetical protein L596_028039 [Steinernema carpocapsae]